MRDEARAAFVESHPDLAIEHVSYDRGDGRYDQDFHADGVDRIVSSDPRVGSPPPGRRRGWPPTTRTCSVTASALEAGDEGRERTLA